MVWKPERRPVEDVAKEVVALLGREGWSAADWLDWNSIYDILCGDYRAVGEGYDELRAALSPGHQKLLDAAQEQGREEGKRIQAMMDEQRREEVRTQGRANGERCSSCKGEVYFMGTMCWGPPTGNGYSEADEYKCAGCLKQWSGHATTYHD